MLHPAVRREPNDVAPAAQAYVMLERAAVLPASELLANHELRKSLLQIAQDPSDAQLQGRALELLSPLLTQSFEARLCFAQVLNTEAAVTFEIRRLVLKEYRALVNSVDAPIFERPYYTEVRQALLEAATRHPRLAVRIEALHALAPLAVDRVVYEEICAAIDPQQSSRGLRSVNFEVRQAQVSALSAVSEIPLVREALLNVLSCGEANFEVRAAALQVLADGALRQLTQGFLVIHPAVVCQLFANRDKNIEVRQVATACINALQRRFPEEVAALEKIARRYNNLVPKRAQFVGSDFYRDLYANCGHHLWRYEGGEQVDHSRVIICGPQLQEDSFQTLCRSPMHNARDRQAPAAALRTEDRNKIELALKTALALSVESLSATPKSFDYVYRLLEFVATVGAYDVIQEVRLFSRSMRDTDAYSDIPRARQALGDLIDLIEIGFESRDKPRRLASLDARVEEASRYVRILVGLESDPGRVLFGTLQVYGEAQAQGRMSGIYAVRLGHALERFYQRDETLFFATLSAVSATYSRAVCSLVVASADAVAGSAGQEWVQRISKTLGLS